MLSFLVFFSTFLCAFPSYLLICWFFIKFSYACKLKIYFDEIKHEIGLASVYVIGVELRKALNQLDRWWYKWKQQYGGLAFFQNYPCGLFGQKRNLKSSERGIIVLHFKPWLIYIIKNRNLIFSCHLNLTWNQISPANWFLGFFNLEPGLAICSSSSRLARLLSEVTAILHAFA